ncbi:hypothetical protein Tco_1353804 [Tanacetum coccineum]
MTSFGARIDESINHGRAPYVFKISGEIYHWIGSLCPPRFLQLYIYDTQNEVANRMSHFGGCEKGCLDPHIVQGLIACLDEHNELVRLFRTARDRCDGNSIPDFKVRLYSVVGAREYDLPTSQALCPIVFDSGQDTVTDYDVVIHSKGGRPQRINKLHPTYMSLQFLLLFIYGQSGFYPEMKLQMIGEDKRLTMHSFYMCQLHEHLGSYGLLFRAGRLFQKYAVGVYCCIEQNRIDFYRAHQGDIRKAYLSGIYDAISRGDREGRDIGSQIIYIELKVGTPIMLLRNVNLQGTPLPESVSPLIPGTPALATPAQIPVLPSPPTVVKPITVVPSQQLIGTSTPAKAETTLSPPKISIAETDTEREEIQEPHAWKGRFFFIDRRAIPDAMCWRHHDSDISDPAPKDSDSGLDAASRGNFLTVRPLLHRIWIGNADSQQRVEASDPKIVATRIRKAQATAKRKAEKNKGSEGASGPEGSSKRRKERSTDQIPCPTPLRTIEAVASDVSRGENVVSPTQAQGDNLLEIPAHDSANTTTRPCEEHHDEHSGVLGDRDDNFDDDVDEEVNLEGPDRHVSDTTERVVIGTESIPIAATRVGADEAGSSLPPPLFVPTWGIHQRSRVTTSEECRDLMANLVPPGVQEEMHLLDNNVVLDRAGFPWPWELLAQAHALRQFESLYDTHHALQESLETTRSHLVQTREDFNVVQNFTTICLRRIRTLRVEDHAHCLRGLAVCFRG